MRDTLIALGIIVALLLWAASRREAPQGEIHGYAPATPIVAPKTKAQASSAVVEESEEEGTPAPDLSPRVELTKKSPIVMPEVPKEAPQGTRIFLQCMELQAGKAKPLTEGQCKELSLKPR